MRGRDRIFISYVLLSLKIFKIAKKDKKKNKEYSRCVFYYKKGGIKAKIIHFNIFEGIQASKDNKPHGSHIEYRLCRVCI